LMCVEQPQDAWQPVDRAVLAARDRLGDQVAGREIRGGVVDVEAEADRHLRAVRPAARLEALAGADVEHLRADPIEREPGARLRARLRGERGAGDGDGEQRACHTSRTPWFRIRKYTATTMRRNPLMPMTSGAPM